MRQLEAALKAASDPTRTRILKMLEDRELCVCQIQAVLRLAPSTVSKHLSLLKSAGLVEDRREGRWIHYRLAPSPANPSATGVLSLLRGAVLRDRGILEDRRRLRKVLETAPVEICALGPNRTPKASR
ncbi:MAG: metalloregulator ArsR/SmtB family transcription factor [Acidobacteriia bacterium]|nr:metalloregulator ArsR/SmtB family transcription factor [Terriglobia bacterium]